MLVLSRQRDETIMIGDDIEVTVVDIRGDKVRLGINAPPQIAVHRKEVYEAIKREAPGQGEAPTSGERWPTSKKNHEPTPSTPPPTTTPPPQQP